LGNISLRQIQTIESLALAPETTAELKSPIFIEKGKGEYQIQLENSRPNWLVFGYGFNKGWIAKENKAVLKKIKINGFANGFFIPQAGEHQIEVIYLPELIFRFSLYISLLALVCPIIYFLLKSRQIKGLKNKIF
jgi:uncharacterized membrane protein YfhO